MCIRDRYVPIRIGYAIDAIIGPGQVDFTVVARHLITVVVMLLCVGPVSYTHLDVYKRQVCLSARGADDRAR